MLRFSYRRSDDGEHWDLCGQLSGPWVDELRSVWRRIRKQEHRAHAVVDLKEVTFIDEAGEELLAEMQSAGADFVATGVEHQYLLAHLSGTGRRSVRRRVQHLGGGRP
jgi:ABC-type transporter Mla MlaB component